MKGNPRLVAIYEPKDRSAPSTAEQWIGWKGEWEVTHLLREAYDGIPTGMPMCMVSERLWESGEDHPPVDEFLWVPITDLSGIEWDSWTENQIQEELATIFVLRFGLD